MPLYMFVRQSSMRLTVKFRHDQLHIGPCSPSVYNISNRDIQFALRISHDDLQLISKERPHPPKWALDHPTNLHELEEMTRVKARLITPLVLKDTRWHNAPILGKLPPMAKAK